MHPMFAAVRVSNVRFDASTIAVLCIALLAAASVAAQTTHEHPALPPQPKPAGSTPASGSTAPPSDHAPAAPSQDHSGMNMPAGHAVHAGMNMPMGQPMSITF